MARWYFPLVRAHQRHIGRVVFSAGLYGINAEVNSSNLVTVIGNPIISPPHGNSEKVRQLGHMASLHVHTCTPFITIFQYRSTLFRLFNPKILLILGYLHTTFRVVIYMVSKLGSI